MTTSRIYKVQWIICTVVVPVHAIAVADGIGLEESADVGIIVSGAVVVESCFEVESSAGEHVRIAEQFGILVLLVRRIVGIDRVYVTSGCT